MTAGRVRLSVAEARELGGGGAARDRLRGRGGAHHRRSCDRRGAVRLRVLGPRQDPQYSESRHFRQPRRPMAVLRETDVSIAFDGGNNVGMLALYHAAQAAIDKAARARHRAGVGQQRLDERAQRLLRRDDRQGGPRRHPHRGAARGCVAPPGGTQGRARHQSDRDRGSVRRAGRSCSTWAPRRSWRPRCTARAAGRAAARGRGDRARRRSRRATRGWRGAARCCRSAATRASGWR